ncbi:hypothetical protein ACTHGU_01850 [Chitinophagaceae bacterium MMS25-I14]
MLPSKLTALKKSLESELYLSDDDKKALQILNVLNGDSNFQKVFSGGDFFTKSFAVAPEYCPNCGKKIS